MSTRADYQVAYDRWQTAPALLTDHNLSALLEFGCDGEADRARAAHVAAITTPAPPPTPPPTPPADPLPAPPAAAFVTHTHFRKVLERIALDVADAFGPLIRDDRTKIAALESALAAVTDRLVELEARAASKEFV